MVNNRYVVVNATALDFGGALEILKQFLKNIPINNFNWILFVSDKIKLEQDQKNIHIFPISGVKGNVRRLLWDLYGVRRWLKEHKIIPSATISLQNTGFNSGYDVPNFIYFHQSITLLKNKWSFFNKEQRSLWFYRNIYPFFVKSFIKKNTEIFVQLNYIKKLFCNKFSICEEKVHVVSPSFDLPSSKDVINIQLPADSINLFYPAARYFYKNHDLLIEAIKNCNFKVKLYLTIDRESIINPPSEIEFLGKISYEDVLAYYKACDAVVFPSYIETYGLPLVEAASLGTPICASDLPYAKEVLDGYDGAHFIPHDNPLMWRNVISNIQKNIRHSKITIHERPSWSYLFQVIENRINSVNQ